MNNSENILINNNKFIQYFGIKYTINYNGYTHDKKEFIKKNQLLHLFLLNPVIRVL